jgi:eukaryotic-like serine/threonine-protein kinase
VADSSRISFNVYKPSGKLRPGQAVECELGAAIDGVSAVAGRVLTGILGPSKYYARLLPVARVHADNTVKALSVLGHPNVIAPIGVGGHDGDVYVIQELPEGESLQTLVLQSRDSGERMRFRDIEQIFRQLVTAVRHAHQSHIRHGALGTSQVRVSKQGAGDLHVQVIDFGLFPLMAAHGNTLAIHDWYQLAPEQTERPSEATPGSDLFSLGVVLVELLTGHALIPPSRTRPWRELVATRPHEVRSLVSRERPDAPDGVLDLVASLMRPNPGDRSPITALDLARLLPRLSWDAKALVDVPAATDARSNVALEGSTSTPKRTSARPATLAPSRSFVVSGMSVRRPASEAPLTTTPIVAVSAPPVAARESSVALPVAAPALTPAVKTTPRKSLPPLPSLPMPSYEPQHDSDDATLSEISEAPEHSDATSRIAPTSWFANEATVLTANVHDLPLDEDTAEIPPETAHNAQAIAAVPSLRSMLLVEGTAILAHPDQLAAARGDMSMTDNHLGLGTSVAIMVPHDTMPIISQVPPMAYPHEIGNLRAMLPPAQPIHFESTMPDSSPAEIARASGIHWPIASHVVPVRIDATQSLARSSRANVAMLVVVIVAAGVVLGLILWGVLQG